MLPLQRVGQVIPDSIDALDISKNVLWEEASRIENTGFDGKRVRSMIVENGSWVLEGSANDLIENELDQ